LYIEERKQSGEGKQQGRNWGRYGPRSLYCGNRPDGNLRARCVGGETLPRESRTYGDLNIFLFVPFMIQPKTLIMVDEC